MLLLKVSKKLLQRWLLMVENGNVDDLGRELREALATPKTLWDGFEPALDSEPVVEEQAGV